MRNPSRVLTRTMITERLWSFDAFTVANVIDVYIGHLRRKIDVGRDVKPIQAASVAGHRSAAAGA